MQKDTKWQSKMLQIILKIKCFFSCCQTVIMSKSKKVEVSNILFECSVKSSAH